MKIFKSLWLVSSLLYAADCVEVGRNPLRWDCTRRTVEAIPFTCTNTDGQSLPQDLWECVSLIQETRIFCRIQEGKNLNYLQAGMEMEEQQFCGHTGNCYNAFNPEREIASEPIASNYNLNCRLSNPYLPNSDITCKQTGKTYSPLN